MAAYTDAPELSHPKASAGSAQWPRRREGPEEEKHCGSLHCHIWGDAPAGLSLTAEYFISLLTADPRCPRAPDGEH